MPLQQQRSGGQQDVARTFTVLEAFRKALSSGGDLDYVEALNVVVVRDTAQVHDELKQMIDRLDVEPAQVFVDVKFVSTVNNDLLSLGVDYGDGGPRRSKSPAVPDPDHAALRPRRPGAGKTASSSATHQERPRSIDPALNARQH
jgi:type II secretory pathway component HofQ